jgi:AcrR family transcriptional regulator
MNAAIELADRDGLAALSMRKLAEDLGVEAMSLYHYFKSKDELLAGMVDRVVGEVALPSGGPEWRAAIKRGAISLHDALRTHPWATTALMSPGGISVARLRYMDALLARLREAGFSPYMTHHAYHALDSHIFGSTLWEAGYRSWSARVKPADVARTALDLMPADRHPAFFEHVRQHLDGSLKGDVSEFEFGLDLILDALERIRTGKTRASKQRSR